MKITVNILLCSKAKSDIFSQTQLQDKYNAERSQAGEVNDCVSLPNDQNYETLPDDQNYETLPDDQNYETLPDDQHYDSFSKVLHYKTLLGDQHFETLLVDQHNDDIPDEQHATTASNVTANSQIKTNCALRQYLSR